jgi:hypothetical protein
LIDAEAAGLLARRELLEGAQESANELLRGNKNERVLDTPAPVVHAFMVRRLEGIGSNVEQLWQPQRDERLLPNLHAFAALFRENDLPLVIAKADERAIIVEVEELARGLADFPASASVMS